MAMQDRFTDEKRRVRARALGPTDCERQFVLTRRQYCNFSPSRVSAARVENLGRVRIRHEEELEFVRESDKKHGVQDGVNRQKLSVLTLQTSRSIPRTLEGLAA